MDNLREQVIASFGLTPDQRAAALERDCHVVVTAGAGSGKTRTLVARYASLLADGHSPRRIAAITFTEKAAREMRSRVRQAVNTLTSTASSETERQRWVAINAELDSARIGTIHSLCSEILRAHPAEAGIDPKFDVIDEGLAAVLRAQSVEDTTAILVTLPEFAPLFHIFETRALQELLAFLLNHRLEALETLDGNIDSSQVILKAIEKSMEDPSISNCISELRSMSPPTLLQDAGPTLTEQVERVLEVWTKAELDLAAGEWMDCVENLYQARRRYMSKRAGGKNSIAKQLVAELQAAYDRLLDPLTGGKDSKDPVLDCSSESNFIRAHELIRSACKILFTSYQKALMLRRSLDFDDLEHGAAQLLKQNEIKQCWQNEISALLVDEFQDTNERQRQIVEALSGAPGRLFVVGDARQSIYRFRKADVTVFRSFQNDVKRSGGLVIDLDQTYRAHEPLLSTTGDLLSIVMGTEDDPSRPYRVPFSPLCAYRKTAPETIHNPHVELVLGSGENADSARIAAAHAMAERLLQLKQQGQICTWDDVALLLRASTGFTDYEDAFEEAGIPFVTVAGRGFYDRPEIRDVLNILRALADPADDLSMAGLLRSPAFGLTDAALYQLRWQDSDPVPYWTALQGRLSVLDPADQPRAERALTILNELIPLVDRIRVSELLKKLVDATDYRAILAVEGSRETGGRLWRNLDKLLSDAYTSGQISVNDFLDALTKINDAGAREGEAPAEAQGSVRLMTIHKSKGLEFPIVVLADASRTPRGNPDSAFLSPNYGLAFKLDPAPTLYRLSQWQDQCQNEEESHRLLYVALTRARDKIIINGHTTSSSTGSWTVRGWLKELCNAAKLDVNTLVQQASGELEVRTKSGQPIRAWVSAAETGEIKILESQDLPEVEEPDLPPLYPPLLIAASPTKSEDEPTEMYPWRATGPAESIPPGVIGQMVHKAIELWLFPDNSRLISLLETSVLAAGLAQFSQRNAAIQHAVGLLSRLQNHPLRNEIEAAERLHEVPYSLTITGFVETGYIDILYRTSKGWKIVDFKTDSIQSAAERESLVSQYTRQMKRYASAIETLLGEKPQSQICFLDDRGRIGLVDIA